MPEENDDESSKIANTAPFSGHSHYYQLSLEKEHELRALYKKLDMDRDGKINVVDLTKALNKRLPDKPAMAKRHAKEIMDKADTNRSDSIDFMEFVHYVLEHEKKIAVVFSDIDRNQDGLVDAREIQGYFESLGEPISDIEARQLVRKMDRNGNLVVDLEEFQRLHRLNPNTSNLEIARYLRHHALFFDMGEDATIPEDFSDEEKQAGVWWRHFVAGAVAGAVSRTSTAPFDRVKIYLQVHGSKHKMGLLSGFRYLWNEGGWKSMWRGNGINVLKIMPESAIKFSSYEMAKRFIGSLHSNPGTELLIMERFVAGASAGIISQTIIYPLEVLKTRLALRRTGQLNRGLLDASRNIYRKDGLRAFYRGFIPNTLGVIPYAGIDLAVYETLKSFYLRRFDIDEPSPLVVLSCGAFSSTCGQLTSYPLALVRTRLQSGVTSSVDDLVTIRGQINYIWKYDGLLGFYRGLVPNLMKVLPAVSISYLVYEKVRRLLGVKMS